MLERVYGDRMPILTSWIWEDAEIWQPIQQNFISASVPYHRIKLDSSARLFRDSFIRQYQFTSHLIESRRFQNLENNNLFGLLETAIDKR